MIDQSTWKKGWALLDAREKRNAWIVLAFIIVAGLVSALMVGSILPFLTVLSNPDVVQQSQALNWFYETGGFETDYDFLLALGGFSIAMIVISNLMLLLRVYIAGRFAMMRVHTLSRRMLSAYLGAHYEYFLSRNSGEMGTQILAETQQVVKQFFVPAADAITSVVTVLCILGLLFAVDPYVTSVAFLVFGGTYVLALLASRRLVGQLGQRRVRSNKARFTAAGEALGGIKDIKIYGREAPFLAQYSKPSERMAHTMVLAKVIGEAPQFVMQMLVFSGMIALCLLLLSPNTPAGEVALAEVVPLLGLFAFAAQRLIPELSRLYRSVTKLQYGAAAVHTVHADMASATAHAAPLGDGTARMRLSRELVFENVCYTYPGAVQAGLAGIDLTIRAGEKIGIVGGTGAGKTTFADIVLGLLQPSNGRLSADGTTITADNIRAWRRNVGYVPQQIFLTDGTFAENIAFGVREDQIDRARVEQVARIAQIHDHIVGNLPEGYDTPVGERGVRLSGGQRQRIGIARALYDDSDLIVFDEATSALDNITERDLIAAIEALPGSKTVVMIAHRLTTVRGCDRILLFDQGRITAMGNWDMLQRDSSTFRALAASTKEDQNGRSP